MICLDTLHLKFAARGDRLYADVKYKTHTYVTN